MAAFVVTRVFDAVLLLFQLDFGRGRQLDDGAHGRLQYALSSSLS